MSTNIGYNQWLSLAKACLKVHNVDRNRSLVTRTSKCGWAIRVQLAVGSPGSLIADNHDKPSWIPEIHS
jgi:hypothetical protein